MSLISISIPAISIREPFCQLILKHGKDCENRTWSTKHRGPLLIHASRIVDHEACRRYRINPSTLSPGHVVGLVTLADVVEGHRSEWAQRGYYHWLLTNPLPFAVPLAARGRVKLFHVLIPENYCPRVAGSVTLLLRMERHRQARASASFRRLRGLANITHQEISGASGIAVEKLEGFEAGRTRLKRRDLALAFSVLLEVLAARLRSLAPDFASQGIRTDQLDQVLASLTDPDVVEIPVQLL